MVILLLNEWVNKSGLIEILPELLKTKVYVGISAGMIPSSGLIIKHYSRFIQKKI